MDVRKMVGDIDEIAKEAMHAIGQVYLYPADAGSTDMEGTRNIGAERLQSAADKFNWCAQRVATLAAATTPQSSRLEWRSNYDHDIYGDYSTMEIANGMRLWLMGVKDGYLWGVDYMGEGVKEGKTIGDKEQAMDDVVGCGLEFITDKVLELQTIAKNMTAAAGQLYKGE